jgi:regulator of cell morphogenesis and NO signaling
MFLKTFNIMDDSFVTDIVLLDYRSSSVFRKYGIDYCCGGRIPLNTACEIRGLDLATIKNELSDAIRVIQISSSVDFNDWDTDFLIDYITNVHHSSLVKNFPDVIETLQRFVTGHQAKYPHLSQLLELVCRLRDNLLPHMEQEEQIIFPYIKQIAHAYKNNESYAALLVRTLRKPVENIMSHEHEYTKKYLAHIRELTNHYTPPANACISHKVSFLKLKELDNELAQHLFLENEILFPKALKMEKELLVQ